MHLHCPENHPWIPNPLEGGYTCAANECWLAPNGAIYYERDILADLHDQQQQQSLAGNQNQSRRRETRLEENIRKEREANEGSRKPHYFWRNFAAELDRDMQGAVRGIRDEFESPRRLVLDRERIRKDVSFLQRVFGRKSKRESELPDRPEGERRRRRETGIEEDGAWTMPEHRERREYSRREVSRHESSRRKSSRREVSKHESLREQPSMRESSRREPVVERESLRREPSRREPSRREASRQDPPRHESSRQEPSRRESSRQESPPRSSGLASKSANQVLNRLTRSKSSPHHLRQASPPPPIPPIPASHRPRRPSKASFPSPPSFPGPPSSSHRPSKSSSKASKVSDHHAELAAWEARQATSPDPNATVMSLPRTTTNTVATKFYELGNMARTIREGMVSGTPTVGGAQASRVTVASLAPTHNSRATALYEVGNMKRTILEGRE